MRSIAKNKRSKNATISLMRNRRGWVEIIEAFIAVLLIAGAVLFLLNRANNQKSDISTSVYKAEISILREIESNDSMRASIILAPEPLPIEWSDPRFPAEVKNKIIIRAPSYLTCIGKICYMNETCVSNEAGNGKDIYSQAVSVTSTLQNVSYRKLNLFCWLEQ